MCSVRAELTSASNKVPAVTLIFWLVKMMSTTVGETAADYLIFNLHLGLLLTSAIMFAGLVWALWIQISASRYAPWKYWLAVVMVSIFGTLITDNLTDQWQVPLAVSTGLFSCGLLLTFWLWFKQEHTLAIQTITTRRREYFYWAAILVTFALGTAAGDWLSEDMALGYATALLIFGLLIGFTVVALYRKRLNRVAAFWIIYVLTRPLGASLGDGLSQSTAQGGLGWGATQTSLIFLSGILVLVAYQTVREKQAGA